MSEPSVALVHEWLQADAGSEQTFQAIARCYPSASLFALTLNPRVRFDLGGRRVHTTLLDSKLTRDRRSVTLPAMPVAWRALGSARFDAVLTSHHAFAHSNQLALHNNHICYVHSPARYVWSSDLDRRGSAWYLGPVRHMLKRVDRKATRQVRAYAANSVAVATRIREFWGRDAEVIHPPVRVGQFETDMNLPRTRDYLLGFGRWVSYKHIDRVIEVGSKAGVPVKIAGSGPDRAKIQAAATNSAVPVQIINSPTHEELRELYRNAMALVFPSVEDFGIIPVEAQAAGTPVVAVGAGGANETIVHGRTGFLTTSGRIDELAEAVGAVEMLSPSECVKNARRFDEEVFRRRLTAWTKGLDFPTPS